MTRILGLVLMAIFAATAYAAPKPPPETPAEVVAAAPPGTSLLSFVSSGDAASADALAIYETAPDNKEVRYRTLTMFGKKDGKFVRDFSSDKLIACSRCSQFHDDPFDSDYVEVTPGRAHIVQMDSGEKPSTTVLDMRRQDGRWRILSATRETVTAGRGETRSEQLALPASGLAADMDAKWSVPVFLNTLVVNNKTGKFMFMHRSPTPDSVWPALKGDCTRQDCTVLVQQEDGCISLVRDASNRSFGGGSPNPKDKHAAVNRAMTACNAAGGQTCKEIRTDCSKGI